MTIDEIKTADFEAIEARSSELEALNVEEISTEEIEARADELEAIEERKAILKAEAQAKAEERARVAQDETLETIEEIPQEEKKMTFEEIRSSQEYLEAFAKMIKTGKDAEVRALATELVSGTVPVPTQISSYVETAWSKLGLAARAKEMNVAGLVNVPYEVSADAAAIHTENGDPVTAENLVLGKVTLTPETIKKMVLVTDEALAMSAVDFLKYIYDEITYQIMLKLDNEVVTKIKASSLTDNTIASAAFDAFSIFKGLSKLADDAVSPIAIMTKDMYFNTVMSIVDDNNRPIYNIVSENGAPSYRVNGVEVVFNATAGNDIIVGDMSGFTVNYIESKNINMITDPYTYAEADQVKIVGNIKVGLGVTKPKHFAVIPVAQG